MRKFLLSCFVFFLSLTVALAQGIQKIKVTELQKIISESKTPLVVSFWATFCKPCIEEMPILLKYVDQYRKDSVKMILVSLDLQEAYPNKIRAFVDKRKIKSKVAWLDEFDADYFCPRVDSSWTGSIPATLFVNNKTGYRRFYEEQLNERRIKAEFEVFK